VPVLTSLTDQSAVRAGQPSANQLAAAVPVSPLEINVDLLLIA